MPILTKSADMPIFLADVNINIGLSFWPMLNFLECKDGNCRLGFPGTTSWVVFCGRPEHWPKNWLSSGPRLSWISTYKIFHAKRFLSLLIDLAYPIWKCLFVDYFPTLVFYRGDIFSRLYGILRIPFEWFGNMNATCLIVYLSNENSNIYLTLSPAQKWQIEDHLHCCVMRIIFIKPHAM